MYQITKNGKVVEVQYLTDVARYTKIKYGTLSHHFIRKKKKLRIFKTGHKIEKR